MGRVAGVAVGAGRWKSGDVLKNLRKKLSHTGVSLVTLRGLGYLLKES